MKDKRSSNYAEIYEFLSTNYPGGKIYDKNEKEKFVINHNKIDIVENFCKCLSSVSSCACVSEESCRESNENNQNERLKNLTNSFENDAYIKHSFNLNWKERYYPDYRISKQFNRSIPDNNFNKYVLSTPIIGRTITSHRKIKFNEDFKGIISFRRTASYILFK